MARGGAYLAGRQLLGAGLRVVGLLVLTRLLGPESYGLYAGPMAVVGFVAVLSTVGLDGLLIRRSTEPSQQEEDQAFSLLLVTSLVGSAVLFAATFGLEAWLTDDRFLPPLRVLLLSVPLNVVWLPAMARLERSLRYKPLAAIELGGDVVYYVVALNVAWAGGGVWAPVAGQLALQAWQLGSASVVSRYRPRWRWRRGDAVGLVRQGWAISASTVVFRIHELVNPLIVGRYLGAAAVGQVALALRIVDTLAVVKRATSRIGTVAMAKVQHERTRLEAAHADGMALQVLGVGPVLGAFAIVGASLIPLAFGSGWGPVAEVYPLIAFTTLVGTMFNLHSAVLLVRGRNVAVLWLRTVQVLLSVTSALVLIPRYGVVGFGWSEVVRAAGFIVVDRAVRQVIVPRYRFALVGVAAFAPWLFVPWVPWPWAALLFAPVVAAALAPSVRAEVARQARLLRAR